MATDAMAHARRTILEIAEAIAPGWERRRAFVEDTTAPVRAWLLERLAPLPGQTVLELAAGAGDTGYEAARRLGPSGRLLSTELSPAMLDVARRRGAELGVDNVEHRLVDAERIPLDGASVDGVICRFGYMLMADLDAALAETLRVLRPGAPVVLAVWGPVERNPFFAAVAAALVHGGHLPAPDAASPGPFALADPSRLAHRLRAAGFEGVEVEEVPVRFALAGVDEYLAVVADTAGPIGLALREVGGAERDVLADAVGARLAAYTGDDGRLEVPGVALAAVGRRPVG
jgi:ubiquinone/menaquinone biosynthesis C-methylase UbiE